MEVVQQKSVTNRGGNTPQLNNQQHPLSSVTREMVQSDPEQAKQICHDILKSKEQAHYHSEATAQLVVLHEAYDHLGDACGFSAQSYLTYINSSDMSVYEKDDHKKLHEDLVDQYHKKSKEIEKAIKNTSLIDTIKELFVPSDSMKLYQVNQLIHVHTRIASALGSAKSSMALADRYQTNIKHYNWVGLSWEEETIYQEELNRSPTYRHHAPELVADLIAHYGERAQIQGEKDALRVFAKTSKENGFKDNYGNRKTYEECLHKAAQLGDMTAAFELAQHDSTLCDDLANIVIEQGETKDKLQFANWYLTRSVLYTDDHENKMATTLLSKSHNLGQVDWSKYNKKLENLYKTITPSTTQQTPINDGL